MQLHQSSEPCNCKVTKQGQHVINLGNYGWVPCDCDCHTPQEQTMDRVQINQALEQYRANLGRQEETLARTLALIDAVKSPDGTAPANLIATRNRQHQTVVNTKALIKKLESLKPDK